MSSALKLRAALAGCIILFAWPLWTAGMPATVPASSAPRATAFIAILDNGFSIRHYQWEALGSQVRLYVSPTNDSFVDVPASSIVRLQVDDSTPIPSDAGNFAQPASKPQWDEHALEALVNEASQRHGIDAELIRSVIAAESGFQPQAVSPKGAQGLMQLMPETASVLGVDNPLDPAANVDAGTRYLRELLVLYNGDVIKALAAYNAGPVRVEQYKGVPPYAETRAYVRRVIRDFNRKKLAAQRSSNARGSQ